MVSLFLKSRTFTLFNDNPVRQKISLQTFLLTYLGLIKLDLSGKDAAFVQRPFLAFALPQQIRRGLASILLKAIAKGVVI